MPLNVSANTSCVAVVFSVVAITSDASITHVNYFCFSEATRPSDMDVLAVKIYLKVVKDYFNYGSDS